MKKWFFTIADIVISVVLSVFLSLCVFMLGIVLSAKVATLLLIDGFKNLNVSHL